MRGNDRLDTGEKRSGLDTIGRLIEAKISETAVNVEPIITGGGSQYPLSGGNVDEREYVFQITGNTHLEAEEFVAGFVSLLGDGKMIRVTDEASTDILFIELLGIRYDTIAPTVTDDITTYEIGTIWVDITTNIAYICVDNTVNAAIWTIINAGGITVTEFDDDVFRIKDDGDDTKKLGFECSGIAPSTTRIYTAPDKNGTLALLNDIPYVYTNITASGPLTLTANKHEFVTIDATFGNIILTVPAASTEGKRFTFKRTDSSLNTVLIDSVSGFDGAINFNLFERFESQDVLDNGTTYFLIGSLRINKITVATNYTVTVNIDNIFCNPFSAPFNVTLYPGGNWPEKRHLHIKNIDVGINAVTVLPAGIETIDNGGAIILGSLQKIELAWNGSGWSLM